MASTSDARGWRLRARAAGLCLLGLAVGPGSFAQQVCQSGPSSLPAGRFQDNGDGTVTDLESKLMWMRCASGQRWAGSGCTGIAGAYGWAAAQQQAQQVSRDGSAFFNDWRVPALRELATITDRGCDSPRTNVAIFPGTPAAPFWTATARPGESGNERKLALSFGAEGVMLARKDEQFHLRLVRTGP